MEKNRFEIELETNGHYFIDDTDLECMKFHLARVIKEIDEGAYKHNYQYQFAKEEVREYTKIIAALES